MADRTHLSGCDRAASATARERGNGAGVVAPNLAEAFSLAVTVFLAVVLAIPALLYAVVMGAWDACVEARSGKPIKRDYDID